MRQRCCTESGPQGQLRNAFAAKDFQHKVDRSATLSCFVLVCDTQSPSHQMFVEAEARKLLEQLLKQQQW
jgi:hypothetical protein